MMKQLSFFKRQQPVLRLFSQNKKKPQDPPMTEDMQFRIPTFEKQESQSIPSFVEESETPQASQVTNQKVERMREYKAMSQQTSQRSSPYLVQNNPQDQLAAEFDKKIEAKFGPQMVQKLNREANLRVNKGAAFGQFGSVDPNSAAKLAINMTNYNSFETPDNTWDVKRAVNHINELKRVGTQKYRYSSFETSALPGKDEKSSNLHFYLNRDRISTTLDTQLNDIIPIENDWQDPSMIPTLQNGLDIILKNPGIFPTESINHYQRGGLGSFFTRLPQYSQINEQCISPYYPPGQDPNLMRIAQENQCRYIMSTSTISSVLSHIYYCLSNFKSPHFNNLSEAYDREPLKFMISQRKPNTVFLTKLDKQKKIYSVDGDSGFIEPSNVVLLKMGKYMEKMLTTDHKFFEDHYVLDPRTNKPRKEMQQQAKGSKKNVINYEEDYFRYMRSGNLMIRSQIDCQGTDAQGNNVVFELKTRATSVLRYEIFNYIDYLDYEIVKYKGKHSSYEREFYDLIRGGFLKYIMQCKIGRMQGALVAYHNTQKIFGFEYIKLEDMEKRVFGCTDFSNVVFKSGLSIIEKTFDYILEDQDQIHSQNSSGQNKIFKIGFYANEYERFLNVLVEVFDDDQFYQERFKNVLPEYMRDPIDYYVSHKIQPQVYKYVVGVYPVLNGQFVDHSPILFEPGDSLQVKHTVQRYGKLEFNEYMKFLHEAYKCDSINLDNEYAGTWSFVV